MQFEVVRVRTESRLIPRWQLWQRRFTGTLWVREVQDAELHRLVRVARLCTDEFGVVDALPPLYDAVLIAAKPDLWSMSGTERVEDAAGTVRAYAQSWLLVPNGSPI